MIMVIPQHGMWGTKGLQWCESFVGSIFLPPRLTDHTSRPSLDCTRRGTVSALPVEYLMDHPVPALGVDSAVIVLISEQQIKVEPAPSQGRALLSSQEAVGSGLCPCHYPMGSFCPSSRTPPGSRAGAWAHSKGKKPQRPPCPGVSSSWPPPRP